jgi:hypothetical protein
MEMGGKVSIAFILFTTGTGGISCHQILLGFEVHLACANRKYSGLDYLMLFYAYKVLLSTLPVITKGAGRRHSVGNLLDISTCVCLVAS